jgi:hypothetical protein
MTKKTFFAQQWLQRDSAPLPEVELRPGKPGTESCQIRNRFPTFSNTQKLTSRPVLDDSRFSPVNCFVPGWKGESLSSKEVIRFERLMGSIQNDVRNELLKAKDFTRTIKLGLYNEFLSYAECLGLHCEGLDDLSKFWSIMTPEGLLENEHVSHFVEIYSGRVATINFLKLRFIAALTDKSGLELTERALLYPTSFLSQIFKKGSHAELNSRALETNLYSWYRPSEGVRESIRELLTLSRSLAITEIIKNVSSKTQGPDQSKIYSHALSHVSLGLFLNSLQINFPLWLETVEGKTLPSGSLEEEEIISCKYFGDYLESLSLSHWLAQDNNINFRWDQILCPDFKGMEFISGNFAKICNELQFLTFLVTKSVHQGEKPIEYICKIMGGHFRNRKNAPNRQGFLLEESNPFYSSTYDRVVLNVCHFPKNNPQHYLMSQISDQIKYLKPNGYLFVLSSKKLFVPSLRERLEPILKELKTEAIFDLEDVRGKGELGSYVYVFRKRSVSSAANKQLCSYFRISADLGSFQQFSSITEHLRSFYLSHLTEMPPMAQLEFSDSFRVEYYQEALVNGMLIHSTNEDSSRITHPAFFKGLLNSCVPLDTLYETKSLTLNDKYTNRENSFNLGVGLKKDTSSFIVIDFRGSEVNVELHPMDTFRSIHSDYGETLCSYFELHPKIPGLNPNILRSYFVTPIGRQVINLTFTGGLSLVKGSLSKLLVPKFLTETEALPPHLKSAFGMFEKSEQEFLEISPTALMKSFNHVDQVTKDILPRYACSILSYYSNLERTLQSLIWKMDDTRYGHKVSFSNPMIQAQLTQKPTRPLYPDNQDVFLEFVEGSSPVDIHLPMTQTLVKVTHEGDLKLHFLELISGDRVIVRLHAEEIIVLFLNFLFSHATDVPISRLLRAVHIPSLEDLKLIVETTQGLKTTYQDLLQKVQNSMLVAFRTHVSPKR